MAVPTAAATPEPTQAIFRDSPPEAVDPYADPLSEEAQKLAAERAARKEARERELLTLGAEARYRAFCADEPLLARRIPQKDLARHLGLTPVGLNRIAMRVRRGGGGA